MNVEIGNKASQFCLWEYMFWIFVTVCLQCGPYSSLQDKYKLLLNGPFTSEQKIQGADDKLGQTYVHI